MKKGDKFPIVVQGITVGEAYVEYIDGDREEATIVVPGQRVVARYRSQLTDEGREADTSGTQTIVTGVEAPKPVEQVAQAEAVTQEVQPATETKPEVAQSAEQSA